MRKASKLYLVDNGEYPDIFGGVFSIEYLLVFFHGHLDDIVFRRTAFVTICVIRIVPNVKFIMFLNHCCDPVI